MNLVYSCWWDTVKSLWYTSCDLKHRFYIRSLTAKSIDGPCAYLGYIKHTLSGGRLNKKDGLTRYGDSHVKDKTS